MSDGASSGSPARAARLTYSREVPAVFAALPCVVFNTTSILAAIIARWPLRHVAALTFQQLAKLTEDILMNHLVNRNVSARNSPRNSVRLDLARERNAISRIARSVISPSGPAEASGFVAVSGRLAIEPSAKLAADTRAVISANVSTKDSLVPHLH